MRLRRRNKLEFDILLLNRVARTERDTAAGQKKNGEQMRKKKWKEFGDVTLQGNLIVAVAIARSKV